MKFHIALIFFISICMLLPMSTLAETSLYVDSIRFYRNQYTHQFQMFPAAKSELRYTRIHPTTIKNLDYFWRGGLNGSYESAYYSSVDGTINSGSLGFSWGGGLSYRLITQKHWGIEPFFGVFHVNRWYFNRKNSHDWRIETGLFMDIPAKMQLIWMYTNKTFRIGLNYNL